VEALWETLFEGLTALPGATVLFSAHGLPARIVEEGDPYLDHVRRTVEALAERMPGVDYRLAFQSRAGPVRWLEPSVAQMLGTLAEERIERVVVVPVSFVSDHIETLFELDVEYREVAARLGIREFFRAPALNTRPAFIRALGELVRAHSART
jgi:ferrochelatase